MVPVNVFFVVTRLQREPTMARIRQWLRNGGFDPFKQGIIQAAELTDGDHAGAIHPFDGLHRITLCKRDPKMPEDYQLPTFIRKMTEEEAARAFDAFNSESKRPNALERYRVGIEYGHLEWCAVRDAFEALGLRAGLKAVYETTDYENGGTFGTVAAMTATKAIVVAAAKECAAVAKRDGNPEPTDEEKYDYASGRLEWVLDFCRAAYYGSVEAHDSDLIQAVAHLRAWHGGPFSVRLGKSLIKYIGATDLQDWKDYAAAQKGWGGSESRAKVMARVIGNEYNATVSKAAGLKNVPPAPITSTDDGDDEDADAA
jgi:hypothetical protein